MDKITIYSIVITALLIIGIILLCGQCGRAGDFAKKYNDIKAEYAELDKTNGQLREQLAIGKTEIERLTSLLSASHKRIVELERISKLTGEVNTELGVLIDGDGYIIEESRKAIEASKRAIEEIERYYKNRQSVK